MTQTAQAPEKLEQKQTSLTTQATLSPSERFTAMIEREFAESTSNGVQLTQFQKKLSINYFLKIDAILKTAEVKRMAKKEAYREAIPYTWQNVNMNALAIDVIAFSAVGLDPTQPNHLNPIPYQNKATGKLDIAFIPGYKGTEVKARKYGLNVPEDVVVEVVYANDHFKAIKRDQNNHIESYEFDIKNPFDRGEVVGGFYYHKFSDPSQNRLRVFSKADIDKRKPDHASAEFWGGEKDNWVDGKKQGTKTVEGWYDEMAYKTIYKAAYSAITIDSEKIDAHYMSVIQREMDNRDNVVLREIANNANRSEIGFEDESPVQTPEVVDTTKQEPSEQPEVITAKPGEQIKAPFA